MPIRYLLILGLIVSTHGLGENFAGQEIPEDAVVPEASEDMLIAQEQGNDETLYHIHRLKDLLRDLRQRRDESTSEAGQNRMSAKIRHVKTQLRTLTAKISSHAEDQGLASTSPALKAQRIKRDEAGGEERKRDNQKVKQEQDKKMASQGKASEGMIDRQRKKRDESLGSERKADDEIIKQQQGEEKSARNASPKSSPTKHGLREQRIKRDEAGGETRKQDDKIIKQQQGKSTADVAHDGLKEQRKKRDEALGETRKQDDKIIKQQQGKSTSKAAHDGLKEQRIKRDEAGGETRKADDAVIKQQQSEKQTAAPAKHESDASSAELKAQRVKRDEAGGEQRKDDDKVIAQQKAKLTKQIDTFMSTVQSVNKQIRTLRSKRDALSNEKMRAILRQQIRMKTEKREEMIRKTKYLIKEKAKLPSKYVRKAKAFSKSLKALNKQLRALRSARDVADSSKRSMLTMQIRKLEAKRDKTAAQLKHY